MAKKRNSDEMMELFDDIKEKITDGEYLRGCKIAERMRKTDHPTLILEVFVRRENEHSGDITWHKRRFYYTGAVEDIHAVSHVDFPHVKLLKMNHVIDVADAETKAAIIRVDKSLSAQGLDHDYPVLIAIYTRDGVSVMDRVKCRTGVTYNIGLRVLG